jgi:hypothetical protein
VGSRVPSHVSVQRFSAHGAPLPSAGSRRARFPVLKGRIEALRLPARASPLPYLFGRGVHALLLRSCSPKRSRRTWRKPSGLEQFITRRSPVPAFAPVDASGISQVPWRSVPCLCPDPRPRPSRRDLATGGLVDAAPGLAKPKAPAWKKISRLTHKASAFAVYASRPASPPPMQDSLPAGGLRLCREGLEPSGSLRKVSGHIHPPFQVLSCRNAKYFQIIAWILQIFPRIPLAVL